MTAKEINEKLFEDGWKEYPSYRNSDGIIPQRMFCKRFPEAEKCECNKPQDKQLEIYYTPASSYGNHKWEDAWSIHCVGELANGQWLRLSVDGLNTLELINQHVAFLIGTWNHAAKGMRLFTELEKK